jgi:hypothetical protein
MRRLTLAFALLGFCLLAQAQPQIWHPAPVPYEAASLNMVQQVKEFASFKADPAALRGSLLMTPMEGPMSKGAIFLVPNPEGHLQRFRVFESPMQSPAIERRTGVKTYSGQGVDDPWATAKLDLGRNGFHGMVYSPKGTYFIEPLSQGNMVDHIVFFKNDCVRTFCFKCQVGTMEEGVGKSREQGPPPLRPGPNRKDYRLALNGTGEYTTFYGGVAQADAGTITIMNRINGVYEKDISIRMVIVAMTNWPNGATDPFTTGTSNLFNQNQAQCDANPGDPNYDIGHLLMTGNGGVAVLNSVGVTGSKAKGLSGLPSPIGDPFAIDYVAHEMGHQYGANHTFNSTSASCSGNRSASNAYEPGSGSTIMAYAGICGSENLQPNSDDYFHINSQLAIETRRNNPASGGIVVPTGNNSPVPNAGPDVTIPQDTPFRLTGTATDPDSDPLTYCWEQYDLGPSTPGAAGDESTRPLFRSFKPVTSPTRWFPKQATVLANVFDQFENLPSVNRNMTFRMTVRDNRAGGGNFDYDVKVVTVSGSAFSVTSPNTNVTWPGGSNQTITWNVGGGSVAPNVNILLSNDGGNSYFNGTATVLASNTPNDGSHVVTLPNTATSQARIIVEAVGNVFYDISNVNFTITAGPQIVNPTNYTIIQGNEPVHNLAALLLSDDSRLTVLSDTVNQSTTILELTSTAPNMSVSRLSFILECQGNDPQRSRNIELWNYSTSSWELVSTTTGTLADSTVQVDITSNPSRFIHATTREMKARARKLSPTISRTFSRIVDRFDRTVWELAP